MTRRSIIREVLSSGAGKLGVAMAVVLLTLAVFVVVTLRHSDVSSGAHPPVTAHLR